MRAFLFLFFLTSGSLILAQSTKKVCFLGNSYTSVNNLPALIDSLANADGNDLIHDQNTPGGYWLEYHSTDATSLDKIAADEWDYVVLQEQSQKPSFPWVQVLDETVPYAEILCDSIRSANKCAIPIFFNTWGREDGDAMWDSINTFEKMNWRLHNAYDYMADELTGKLAPIGIGFGEVYTDVSPLISHDELYTADGSHPSTFGSYLAACIFYEIIFEESCVGNTYLPSGILTAEATYLQNVADHVVNDVDSVTTNYVIPEANFETEFSGLEVSCTNLSTDAFFFEWGFGDGNSSNEKHPVHTYDIGGDYTISLSASYCEGFPSDDTTHIETTSVTEISGQKPIKMVNPSNGFIRLFSEESIGEIRILSMDGKEVFSDQLNQTKFKYPLNRGNYVVEISGHREILIVR